MEGLVAFAVIGAVGLAFAVIALLWLRQRPDRRAWAPVALVVTVGSLALLAFLLGPVALWAALGFP